jgi:chemotaxis protein methyltransferase CheR
MVRERTEPTAVGLDRLNARDFQRLARFIEGYSGIKMPPTKKTMVEGRLRRRVREIGCANLTAYCRHLFEHGGLEAEAVNLIDVVTTNKTEFFRESEHFRLLTEIVLPPLLSRRRAHHNTPIKVWSAASSTGAEPYTLAMVLADQSRAKDRFRFSVLATDICTRVLETAAMGIYAEEMIAPVPMEMRRRYLLRARDSSRRIVRIAPEIRQLVKFSRLNLMDATYPVDRDLDVIFCRNILIYFDKPTQEAVLRRLGDHLRPGGYLFLGHSESLAGFGLAFRPIAATIFQRE